MAKQHPNPPRKQRTREHVLADLSANHVERFALQCGFAVDRLSQDYGLDLAMFTFDEFGFLERGVLWVQLKATEHLKTTRDRKKVVVRIDRRDLLAWIAEPNPVFLVVYDAVADCGYWLSIHAHFADAKGFGRLSGKTVTVSVPKTNLVSVKAMREFAREKAAIRTPQDKR